MQVGQTMNRGASSACTPGCFPCRWAGMHSILAKQVLRATGLRFTALHATACGKKECAQRPARIIQVCVLACARRPVVARNCTGQEKVWYEYALLERTVAEAGHFTACRVSLKSLTRTHTIKKIKGVEQIFFEAMLPKDYLCDCATYLWQFRQFP